jgi:phage terminase small subunit
MIYYLLTVAGRSDLLVASIPCGRDSHTRDRFLFGGRLSKKLTIKQDRFCNEYVTNGGDASAAYRTAYDCSRMKSQSVNRLAFALIQNIKITSRIEELKKRAMASADLTPERVMLEVARLAFNDPRKVFDESGRLLSVDKWPDDVAASISSIEVDETLDKNGNFTTQTKKIKFWDKGKQLDLASKLLGLVIDKKDVSVSGKDGAIPHVAILNFDLSQLCSEK